MSATMGMPEMLAISVTCDAIIKEVCRRRDELRALHEAETCPIESYSLTTQMYVLADIGTYVGMYRDAIRAQAVVL